MTAATECGFEILPHPPYSPDMAPYSFILFPKLKSHLRGTQYGSNEGVIEAVNEYLGDQKKAFSFEDYKGDYIEKYWSNFHTLVARSIRGQELFDYPSYNDTHNVGIFSHISCSYCYSFSHVSNKWA